MVMEVMVMSVIMVMMVTVTVMMVMTVPVEPSSISSTARKREIRPNDTLMSNRMETVLAKPEAGYWMMLVSDNT
jgi:hypothetical protein